MITGKITVKNISKAVKSNTEQLGTATLEAA